MKLIFFLLYLASIFFSILMAFKFRVYLHSRHLFILLPYLIYVFLQESILGFAYYLNYYTSNAVVYNIYRPITIIVFFWIYYNINFMRSLRKLLVWLTAIYIVIILINYFFFESILSTSSYLILARGFVITFFAILFLYRYFLLDNPKEEKYWQPLIWITIGIIIFYPVISIAATFQKYLAADKATLYGIKLYNIIPQVMSIFMYSCFSYAFYLCKKKN